MKRYTFVMLLAACATDPKTSTPPPTPPATPAAPMTPPDLATAKSTCPEFDSPGVAHKDNITTDQTWLAKDNPHLITVGFNIEAKLTLEPCVVVLLSEGVRVNVGNETGKAGSIVAQGTYDATAKTFQPVLFLNSAPDKSWGSLFVRATGFLDFKLVVLLNGGKDDATINSTIEARGKQAAPLVKNLRFQSVAISGSKGNGITLSSYAGFTDDSDDVEIDKSEREPLDVEAPGLHTIPAGVYTGNGKDEIRVRAQQRVTEDEAFHNRGIPYRVTESIRVYDTSANALTVTIDPGVKIMFDKNTSGFTNMVLGDAAGKAPVKLLAQGTAKDPIVLTSGEAQPAKGDWGGIYFHQGATTGNAVTYTTFEYAGGGTGTNGFDCGPGGNNGGLLIIEWQPDSAFVTHSTFQHLYGAGIVSGWTAPQGSPGPNLTADNTFSDISPSPDNNNYVGFCNVTQWASDGPMRCPGDARPYCAP